MGKIVIIVLTLLTGSLLAEHHGLWVVRNSLNSAEDLQKLEEIHQKLQLTDLYLQVRALGINTYEQSSSQRISIDDIVKFCHQRKIRIHAWINVLYIWAYEKRPSMLTHTFNLEEDHLMTDVEHEKPDIKFIRQKGVEGFFIDPAAFGNFTQIVKLSRNLLNKHNFDGIHLDYLRYPGREFLFSNYLRTQFMKHFYIDPVHFFKANWTDVSQQKWYRNFLLNELNNFVENLRNELKSLNSSCLVSVAVKPDLKQAKIEYFQDWLSWLKNADCDYVVMMNYAPDPAEFNKNLENAASTEHKDQIVCGIGAYYLDQKQLEQRMNLVQNSGLKGYALFSFTTLKEQPEILSLVNFNN